MRVWLALKATNSPVHSRRYFINAGVASPRSNWAFAQACRILAVSISKRRCWRGGKGMADIENAIRRPMSKCCKQWLTLAIPMTTYGRVSTEYRRRIICRSIVHLFLAAAPYSDGGLHSWVPWLLLWRTIDPLPVYSEVHSYKCIEQPVKEKFALCIPRVATDNGN